MPPSNTKKRPLAPPPALVRLLQTDRSVLEYFESLQDALAADVQKWKDRASAKKPKTTTTPKAPAKKKAAKKPPPPKESSTLSKKSQRNNRSSPDRRKEETIDDGAFGFLDSSDDESQGANRPKKKRNNQQKSASPARRTQEPIDDGAFGFLDSSDDEEDEKANTTDQQLEQMNDDDFRKFLGDSSSSESEEEDHDLKTIQLFGKAGEKMLHELGIELVENSIEGDQKAVEEERKANVDEVQNEASATIKDGDDDDAKKDPPKLEATGKDTTPQSPNQLEITANDLTIDSIVEHALQKDDSMAVDPVENDILTTDIAPPAEESSPQKEVQHPRSHADIAEEICQRFADHYTRKLMTALALLDATHHRGLVDSILEDDQKPPCWLKACLYQWRGETRLAVLTMLECLVNKNNSFAVLEACFVHFDQEDWIKTYVDSLFEPDDRIAIMEALAFIVRKTISSLDDEEEGEKPADAWDRWATTHAWLKSPVALVPRLLNVRNKIINNKEQRSIWLAVAQLVLLLVDADENIAQDESDENDDDDLQLLYCQVERQLTLRSPDNDLPTLAKSPSLECAVTLADGHKAIEIVQSLLRAPSTKAWESIGRYCTMPVVRVITLQRRRDRFATLLKQALRQGILVLKGVIPLDDDSAEYGSFAFDGTGRLVEATQRIEEYVGEDEQKYLADEWVPNDLLPFDREAPKSERMVGTTPSEKACILSHVSCWKGVERSLKLVDESSEFPKDTTEFRLWRHPCHIVRLFKIAGFASGKPLDPKNEAMNPAPVCVILEDDSVLVEGFAKKLAKLLEDLPRDFHYCSLGYSRPRSAPIVPLAGMVGVPTMLWYLTGYCLSLAGAQYLLKSLPVEGPADTWIGLKMAHENWRDTVWGTRLGVGAHAQPTDYPSRTELASVLRFHAYCAMPPLCCQPMKSNGNSKLQATGRKWRQQRDTDIVYSGDLAKVTRR